MKISAVITDTYHAPERWYTVTTHEADDKITTVSRPSFALALEFAIRECNSIENDMYHLTNEPDCIFAEDLRHSFPVTITVNGDYHNVVYYIEESEE